MLGRLRKLVNRLAPTTVGVVLARMGVKADHVTYMGLVLAALAPLAAYLRALWALPVVLIASGAMDVIDGAVARASGSVRPFGSYLDSMTDRVEDFLYFLALALAGVNPLISMTALAFSLMVSYARSKGELVGAKMEGVGLMERSERILVLFVAALLLALGLRLPAEALISVVAALEAVTVVQRSVTVWRHLRSGTGSAAR